MIIDSHCHMYDKAFEKDFDEVYNRALNSGVSKFLMVGCSKESNDKVLKLQNTYKESYATVGIHPSYVNTTNISYLNELEEIIKSNKIYAIGECGLDYYWVKDNKEVQKLFFIKQIELAIKYNLPLIIHTREAVNDMYNILKEYPNLKYVLHGYSGSVEMAKKFVQLGAKLGIGGVVTFKNAKNIKDVVKEIPLQHLLLETDCPYLTPHPHRSKRNEPSYLTLIAEEIALIKEISVEEVYKTTIDNTNNLFKLEK